MEDYRESSSLKHKLKSSTCFSCCFNSRDDTVDSLSPSSRLNNKSSSWLKSTARELPEMKEKCKNLVSRMGRSSHQRRNSAELRYDPLSYALNFDEGLGNDDNADDELPLRNFSTRLPVSPMKDRMKVQRQRVFV